MGDLAAIALVTAGLTTATLVMVRPVLRRLVPDVPNYRSSHLEVVPRGGGIGVLAGVLAGSLASGVLVGHREGLALFVAPLTLLALLGFLEDLVGLSVRVRLTGQLLVATGCAAAAVLVGRVDLATLAGWSAVALVVLSGVFYVNAANFVDGVNGISGMHGLLTGTYFAGLGISASSTVLTVAGVLTSVGFASFLPWNLPRAALFLGDVGSYLLGGAVWLSALIAVLVGVEPVAAAAPLAVYSADVATTLVRRLRAGRSLVDPHREHTYQRVQQLTGSHLTSALLCTGATALCAGVGWWVVEGLPATLGGTLVVAVSVGYLGLPWVITADRGRRMAAL